MDPRDEKSKVWMNGKFVDWQDATVHVMSHVLHYGSSVFEGIRCYKTKKGSSVFRLGDHIQRLLDSAKIYRMPIPYSKQEIVDACKEAIKVNGFESGYLRPIAYRGYHSLGVDPTRCPVDLAIGVLNWGKYLGDDAIAKGVDVCVSSWNRLAPNTMPAFAKASANYMGSQLIKQEAIVNGYTEGIGLDIFGFVSEGSGENIFVVRNGVITTPPYSASILPGITRDCVLKIGKELGVPIIEQNIPREMLYIADEVFFSGTAAEISPIRSIDRVTIGDGSRGPIAQKFQQRYFEYVNDEREDIYGWHDYVK